MYSYILDGLVKHNQINNVELYLQSLQYYVKQLRQSYKVNQVRVDYSDSNIQAAYLLAYYPQYTEMTYKVLCDLNHNYLHPCFVGSRELQACFFCAGPAPETVAWVKYLSSNYSTAKYAVAHTYDIAANTWSKSREITKNVVASLCPGWEFTLNGYNLNLCQQNAFPSIRDIIQTSNLFFVQNCLNEFISNSEIFINNLDFLITEMPANSIIIRADLNYKSVVSLMEQIEAYVSISTKSKIIRSYTAGDIHLHSSLILPPILKNNLLTGADGLIPKSNINFKYLAIQKLPIAVEPSYADIPF
jgi:hypothetical protein